MNWIRFALWLSAIYFTYYGGVILWDMLRIRKVPPDERSHVLTFVEDIVPVSETPEPAPEIYDSSVLSSGGVSLKQMFSLCREEAVEFTRPVSF